MQRDCEVIGVIGAGVVGGVLAHWAQAQGHDVRVYDPPKGHADIGMLADAPTIFVCVPTPYTAGVGFDDRLLLQSMALIPGQKTVVIKSTVLPGTTDLLQSRYPQHRVMFNPEFLREATAFQDFAHPDRQIVGRTASVDEAEARRIMAMLPIAPYEQICGAGEAEMAKYMANTFLAVKVSFANDMFDLCERLDVDYSTVKDIVAADERIGPSHMDVLHGGYRGYGGKCLPKDSRALLDLARSAGIRMEVLQAADRVNAILRPDATSQRGLHAVSALHAVDSDEQAA
jgi:UDPglucose 6-dehydrogenase